MVSLVLTVHLYALRRYSGMPDSITLPDGRKLDSLKVADLKTELETLGLDKSGLKKDLVQRLARVFSYRNRV